MRLRCIEGRDCQGLKSVHLIESSCGQLSRLYYSNLQVDSSGKSVFHFAIGVRMALILVNNGASVDIADNRGKGSDTLGSYHSFW